MLNSHISFYSKRTKPFIFFKTALRRPHHDDITHPIKRGGAHAKGYNAHSIGIYYEGGPGYHGLAKDMQTEWQRHSLRVLIWVLKMDYPKAKVVGHRDLSPDVNGKGEVEPMEWTKECPCFEVRKVLHLKK